MLVLFTAAFAGCNREQADLVRPVDGELAAFPVWTTVYPPAAGGADLVGLSVFRDGAEAWAVGGRTILHRVGREWHADTLSVNAPSEWTSVAFSEDAGVGFAVGDGGWIARYAGGHHWTVRQESPAAQTLTSVWLDPSGREGFAVGRGGVALRWLDGRWSNLSLASRRPAGLFLDVAATEHELWVRDSAQVSIYSRSSGGWIRNLTGFRASDLFTQHGSSGVWVAGVRQPAKEIDQYSILSLEAQTTDTIKHIRVMPRAAWMWTRPRCGVAAGREPRDEGKMFVHRLVYVTPTGSFTWPTPDSVNIHALWTNRTCTEGWAVGSGGFAGQFSVQRLTIRGMRVEFGTVEQLSGTYTLELGPGVPRPAVDSLALLAGESVIRLVPSRHFTVSPPSSPALEIEINNDGRAAASPLKGKQIRLRFYLSYPVGVPRYPVAYEKVGSFVYEGKTLRERIPWKWLSILAVFAVTVWYCGRAPWLLRLLFTPSGRALLERIPFVSAMPAFVTHLLETSPGFKWYFFGRYRKRLAGRYLGGGYPSHAELAGCDGLSPTAGQPPPEPLCRHAFGHVLGERNSVLWVEDRDGSHGRPLLSRWVGEAVRHKRTPVYLDLRDSRPFDAQIRAAWSLLGDIPEGVPELWKSGGFLFLLDGTRGENSAEATNAFIQDERGRNVIVVCRRTPPDIDGVCHLRIDPLQAG